MTDSTSTLADLLAECDAHSIRLSAADGGGLEIDAPQDTLTPDLLDRLRTHKGGLLTLLRPTPNAPSTDPTEPVAAGDATAKPVCRCGSTIWRDVPIHGGQFIRRDCCWCGRFLDFPIWHGKNAGHNGQQSVG